MGQEAKEVVVNASVFLAAILLDEPVEVSKPAFLLLLDIMKGKLVVHVPDRFEDEVLGGLIEAFTRGRPMLASPEGVFRILQRFLTKVIVHHRDWHWNAQEVFSAALRWRVSYYDAVYLLVAQKLGATYWTADKKLLRFLQRQKFTDLPNLGWIGSYR